jgi:hypothetical protein
MVFESGGIWSDEVWDFTWGSEVDDREQFRELNNQMLEAHHANITVWGSDTDDHEGEPLDRVIVDALKEAGVEVKHQAGPRSVGGMVAVIVGSNGSETQD